MTAEPWLRGTLTDVPVVARAVLHALELAREDIVLWCGELTDADLNARPNGVAPVAFHIRHICRSVDRLLTYAEGHMLLADQIASMKAELDEGATHDSLFWEFRTAMERIPPRVKMIGAGSLETPRIVGRKGLPTTVGGLLIHTAEHTQRHVGQAITTAKIVVTPRVIDGGTF
jgi:DinB family protein